MTRKIKTEINDEQNLLQCSDQELRDVVEEVFKQEGIQTASISLAIVDDTRMPELNRRFMDREGTTDVLAFNYEQDGESLEGEIVVSAEVALEFSRTLAHSPRVELLLYVAHGALHLTGWDDKTPQDRARMNARAADMLTGLGWSVDENSL